MKSSAWGTFSGTAEIDPGFFADWYKAKGRNFPWRDAGVSPFHLLVTEMLLRQTRAEQVARLWGPFMGTYPNVVSLAAADDAALYEQVKELGFGRQRIGALKSAAQHLLDHHAGQVPPDKDALQAVPHVGLYAAHAVLCFAFNQAVPVVDINILRLFARIEGKKVAQPDIRRNPWVWEVARELIPGDPERARQHNYGILDFTGEVCKPRGPLCEICPLVLECRYGSSRVSGETIEPPW